MEEFLTNHQFTVHIGESTYGFSKVSNLVQEQEYDSIQEGEETGVLSFSVNRRASLIP